MKKMFYRNRIFLTLTFLAVFLNFLLPANFSYAGTTASYDWNTWTKYASNPIVSPTPAETDAYSPIVVRVGPTDWRMLFKSETVGDACMKYSTSSDGKSWTRQNGDTCVFSGTGTGTWDHVNVRTNRLFYDGTTYHLIYSANDVSNITRVGYATSTNLLSWTRSPSNPILEASDFSWSVDQAWILDVVIKDGVWYFFGNTYDDVEYNKLFYTKGTGWTDPTSIQGPTEILDASGVNGEHEKKTSLGFHQMGSVFKIDNLYYLFYSSEVGSKVHIHWATSTNLENWTKQRTAPDILPTGGSGTWDERYVFIPKILKENQAPYASPMVVGGEYYLYYSGRDTNGLNSSAGLATISSSGFADTLGTLPTGKLFSYWKLDETVSNSTVVDSSGNLNNGTPFGSGVGSMPQPSTDVASGFGFSNTRSLSFDGLDDRVTAFNQAPPSRGSVSLWFKSTGNTGAAGYIFSSFDDLTAGRLYLFVDTDGALKARLGGNAATTIATGITNDGLWHHVVLVYGTTGSVGQSKVYLDGGPAVNIGNPTNPLVIPTQHVTLGANRANGGLTNQLFFKGLIDDVRVYDRVLSSAEVSTLSGKNHLSATWDGSLSSDWEDGSNWDINAVPDNFTRITVADTANDPVVGLNTQLAGLTINSGAVLDLSSFDLQFNDSGLFVNNGTLKLSGSNTLTNFSNDTDSGSIEYTGSGNYSSGLIAGDIYNNLAFSGSGTWTLDAPLDANGSISLSSGSLVSGGNNINISGNWNKTGGSFTHGNNTVVFDGVNQSISGSNTFYNLTKIESSNNATDENLTFTAGTSQIIANTLTLDGRDADDRINLISSIPGTTWSINPQGSRIIDYIEVTDSNNINSTNINCLNNCLNGGNNTNWFDVSAPSISLTPLSPDPNSDDTPTISGTAVDSVGTVLSVEFQIDGTGGSWSACVADDGAFDESSEAFTCTSSTLANGSHTIYVRATDNISNTTLGGSESTGTFTIGSLSGIQYGCTDPRARNYQASATHNQSLCEYKRNTVPVSSIQQPVTNQQPIKTVLENATKGASCPFFSEYYTFGQKGDGVKLIQTFLKTQGIDTGSIDGFYGKKTDNAIRVFQAKYFDEILKPWNLSKPTGRWYKTTRAKANALSGCPEEVSLR